MSDQIVKSEPLEPLAPYIRRPEIMDKFALILGNDKDALRFVQSVILLVETAEPGEYSLKNCNPRSIVRCALKAAVQRVTVNAEDRQAFMIPNKITRNRGKANETTTMEARFQFHYQEVYNRAMRTNRYSIINVSPVPVGTEVMEDYITGMIYLQHAGGLLEDPKPQTQLRLRNYSDRNKPRQGWIGYYRTRFGAEKMIYLPMEEIERRANFNKAHAYSFGWKDHREAMEMKTVLLALLRLADLTVDGMQDVKSALETIDNTERDDAEKEPEAIQDGEISEADYGEYESSSAVKHTAAQNISDLGFDAEPEPVAEKMFPQSSPATPAEQQARHAALWRKVGDANLINQTTLGLWKRRSNDTAESVAEKCDMMEIALGKSA
jgi:phage RecT family recombinase